MLAAYTRVPGPADLKLAGPHMPCAEAGGRVPFTEVHTTIAVKCIPYSDDLRTEYLVLSSHPLPKRMHGKKCANQKVAQLF